LDTKNSGLVYINRPDTLFSLLSVLKKEYGNPFLHFDNELEYFDWAIYLNLSSIQQNIKKRKFNILSYKADLFNHFGDDYGKTIRTKEIDMYGEESFYEQSIVDDDVIFEELQGKIGLNYKNLKNNHKKTIDDIFNREKAEVEGLKSELKDWFISQWEEINLKSEAIRNQESWYVYFSLFFDQIKKIEDDYDSFLYELDCLEPKEFFLLYPKLKDSSFLGEDYGMNQFIKLVDKENEEGAKDYFLYLKGKYFDEGTNNWKKSDHTKVNMLGDIYYQFMKDSKFFHIQKPKIEFKSILYRSFGLKKVIAKTTFEKGYEIKKDKKKELKFDQTKENEKKTLTQFMKE